MDYFKLIIFALVLFVDSALFYYVGKWSAIKDIITSVLNSTIEVKDGNQEKQTDGD